MATYPKQEERVNVANAEALAREAEANATRRGDAAEAVQMAMSLEAGYKAEQQAEIIS
jgi:flotillin